MSETTNRDLITEAEADLRDEHQHLHQLAGQLQEVSDVAGLRELTDELYNQLRAHFRNEEYPGGLYDRIGATSPHHAEDVRELVGEHYHVLTSVFRLRAMAYQDDRESISDIVDELEAVMTTIREHEKREHKLAAEAMKA